MRLPSLPSLLAVLVLVTGGAALAQRRQLQEFEGQALTQQERDAARSRPKYNINPYGRDIPVKEEPFPWKAVGLAAIAFCITAPFAWIAYRNTTKEMANAHVFGVSNEHAGEDGGARE